MNIMKSLQIATVILINCGIPQTGLSQVYTLPQRVVPFSGLALAIADGGFYAAKIGWQGVTFTDTAYLDATALTVRQVGAFSLATTDQQSVTFHEILPSTGDLTVGLSIAGGSVSIPFDTGPRGTTWNPEHGAFVFGSNLNLDVDIPVSGTYSLVTPGQTYTGSFNYSVHLSGELWLPNLLYTTDYPASIELGPVPGVACQEVPSEWWFKYLRMMGSSQ